MSAPKEERNLRTIWEGQLERCSIYTIGFLLAVIGAALHFLPVFHDLTRPLGDALFVAGILVCFVDPLLKKRLLKEASQGIFHYILGFNQDPKIQDRLKEITFGTKLLRRNYHCRCVMRPADGKMSLKMECSFEVINPTNEVVKYPHDVQCEIAEHPSDCTMTLLSTQKTYEKPAEFKSSKDDPEVLQADGEEVEIRPLTEGVTYRFGTNFSVVYPLEFFHILHFRFPTIGVRIEVEAPAEFKITATNTQQHIGRIWQYDSLFMPGEKVFIRWQREEQRAAII
jgi:hypothetical protein